MAFPSALPAHILRPFGPYLLYYLCQFRLKFLFRKLPGQENLHKRSLCQFIFRKVCPILAFIKFSTLLALLYQFHYNLQYGVI